MSQLISPEVIRNLPLFAGLNEEEKSGLLSAGKVRQYPNGKPLFAYGDVITRYYVVCSGAVQLFRETPDGHEMTSDILLAGASVGLIEIMQSQATYQFNAVAVKETLVMEFPVGWIQEKARSYSSLALNFLAMVARRAHTSMIEGEHKATMTAAQQIACFLQRLCMQCDCDPHDFHLPYSKTLMASRLGMELETLSRALAKIRLHGISITGSLVSFDDIAEVKSFVCDNCSIVGGCREHERLKDLLAKETKDKETFVA